MGEIEQTLDSIRRVDKTGHLYCMDYYADYYAPEILAAVEQAGAIDAGCSAFATYNVAQEFLLCRNYDYSHKDPAGAYTGLNVVLKTAPHGKLKSIGVCDAIWLDEENYFTGVLDDGKTDRAKMLLAPYMCVDAMNEAGLVGSLLVVDLKQGESLVNQSSGKERIAHSVLLRRIIDNAHNIDEAVAIARSFDIYSIGDTDLHVFLVDKSGDSAVLEWRRYGQDTKHELYVSHTNAVTNFFASFDDGEDVYRNDGSLKELCSRIEPTANNYRYGYGHGYHRFNGIVSTLERFVGLESKGNEYGIKNSVMAQSQAVDILRIASQEPGTEKTSYTQYSAIYNLEKLTVQMWGQRDYETPYLFGID